MIILENEEMYLVQGEIDYDQVAEIIVRDIRNQHFGKLSFDIVDEQLEKEAVAES